MNKNLILLLACVFLTLPSCDGGGVSGSSSDSDTAPTLGVELQSSYKTDDSGSAEEWSNAVINFQGRQTAFNVLGNTLEDNSVDPSGVDSWVIDTTYDLPGNNVKYSDESLCGVFANAWWTLGDEPSFVPSSSSPWKIVELLEADCTTAVENNVTDWDENGEYYGGSYVMYGGQCYQARYWTKGDTPDPDPVNFWDTPWEVSSSCDTDDEEEAPIINPVGGGKLGIEELPSAASTAEVVLPEGTPVVPPVILSLVAESSGSAFTADTELPSDGYEFLRLVTDEHWDYLFPLRSGRYNAEGDYRNRPPIAEPDGSTDSYTLTNFIKAVLLYNAWAEERDYKLFLNEGTLKQQAQEFIAFCAKSARETSGSWSNAPEPWIVSYTSSQGETTDFWKGALYWVDEKGRSTADDGTSTTIEYADAGSKYTPVAGRSYYGRGVIQITWNYNYGPFSNWLYDNGFFPELVTTRNYLLTRPDYVAIYGDLSILSGIWFWMTPQGAKPSCHDVLYGAVYNVSSSTNEQGLPPRNDGGTIDTAAGDTDDEAVFAYRIGAIINIVNGGKECNKAAAWHEGPMQRISYYNAYAMYFMDQISGLDVTRITAATNVWDQKISDSSEDILKTSSCYAQKSYYSW